MSVDRRTITRWRGWWRKVFTATRFWAAARAGFMPPIDEAQLPGALIERLAGDAQDRLIGLLRERTGNVLARLYPQDKTQNASGLRRSLEPIDPPPI